MTLAGLKLDDIGVIELNEAFAVQALAVIRAAGLDPELVNVNGGAIALGHPLGCTGAKLTATILREMERRGARYGMVTMCIGGGQGAAGIFERIVIMARHCMQDRAARSCIEDQRPKRVFTPEDFTDEHRAIAQTTRRVLEQGSRAAPRRDPASATSTLRVILLRKSAATGADRGRDAGEIRRHGDGSDVDDGGGRGQSRATDRIRRWHGAHTGIGTLPLLLFGTEAQKEKYLPKLATAEMIAAYCLSEPQAGSDALAARHARRSVAGRHALRPQRPEDVDHQRRLRGPVHGLRQGRRREVHGVSGGARVPRRHRPARKKRRWGSRAAPPRPSIFDNVKVPVENVLGEIGRGHIIAFNILNLGRLKLGPFAHGGAEERARRLHSRTPRSARHSANPSREFGMIQHKLAEMAIRMYATEIMTYRVVGMIESQLEGFSWDEPDAARRMLKAVEEFAAECSFIKVFASEMLDYVVDEGVQIHGGYGYHQDYAVERAYRDSRINRIFEGTNEINRLLATGMLLKRAQQGRLGLVKAAKALMDEILSGPSAERRASVPNAKKIALLLLAHGLREIRRRARKAAGSGRRNCRRHDGNLRHGIDAAALAEDRHGLWTSAQSCSPDAMARIEMFARPVLAACSEGDALRANMAVLRRFAKYEPVDSIALRRRIAERLLTAGRYVV